MKRSAIDRFSSKFICAGEDECWNWLAAKINGYGWFHGAWKSRLAHRIAYELRHGTFDTSLDVLHKCDNPSCVNPKHLFLGTHTDNMRDMMSKGRHKAPRGIEQGNSKLDEEKVRYIRSSDKSKRVLAKELNVSHGLISHVRVRKTWKHVD